ncbi:MAG TPA: hypothetical protein VD993_16930 [Chitinophagaceae bacterium]|nr:hypothetical protein [Chitinophagaceae bacterium]
MHQLGNWTFTQAQRIKEIADEPIKPSYRAKYLKEYYDSDTFKEKAMRLSFAEKLLTKGYGLPMVEYEGGKNIY